MTARRLVLLRHAKAALDGTADFERSLAPRGRSDAGAIGRWLVEHGYQPDHVVVSPARRALQTWELAAAEIEGGPVPLPDERVYTNTLEDLLDVVRGTPSAIGTVILVGHNPALAELAVMIDDGSGDRAGRSLAVNFPAGGVAVFSVAGNWAEVDAGAGRLVTFAAPPGVTGG